MALTTKEIRSHIAAGVSDTELGAFVRGRLADHDLAVLENRVAGYARALEKTGERVTVDGVEFPSKGAACKALGITRKTLNRMPLPCRT